MVARYGPWLALVGGGIAWTVHLSAGYFLVSVGCPRSWPLGWTLAVVTVLAAGASLAVGMTSLRGWRRAPEADRDDPTTRRLFFAAGALLAGLFTVAILLGGLAAVILSPCRGVAIGG